MKDRFLDDYEVIERLVKDYNKHGKLIIAFDFDNTLFDYHCVGDEFPKLTNILQRARDEGHILVLFTANEGLKLSMIRNHLHTLGLNTQYVNESPVLKGTRKPYYNILLDDRAGLKSAYKSLDTFLKLTYE